MKKRTHAVVFVFLAVSFVLMMVVAPMSAIAEQSQLGSIYFSDEEEYVEEEVIEYEEEGYVEEEVVEYEEEGYEEEVYEEEVYEEEEVIEDE